VSIEHGKIHPSTAEPGTWRGGCPASLKAALSKVLAHRGLEFFAGIVELVVSSPLDLVVSS